MRLSDFQALSTSDAVGPGTGSATVVPSNTVNFVNAGGEALVARRLEVFSDGTVSFVGCDGVTDTRTFTSSMSYPQIILVATIRVNATGTSVTAGNIKAIW